MSDLTDKVALVTGSGRGIGRGIAIRLAQDGADIVVNYFRNRKPAENTAQEIMELGRRAIVVKANVGELDQLSRLYDVIEDEFGTLDILVHNAASGYLRPVLEQKPRGWEWTMNINARSLLFGAQHAARLMEGKRGVIVAISSLGSMRAFPDYVVVGASKEEGQLLLEEAVKRTPVGRLCTPEDIADLVCFLCSPGAAMICGQTIIMDGGYSISAQS